jgi:hypothetical protein
MLLAVLFPHFLYTKVFQGAELFNIFFKLVVPEHFFFQKKSKKSLKIKMPSLGKVYATHSISFSKCAR